MTGFQVIVTQLLFLVTGLGIGLTISWLRQRRVQRSQRRIIAQYRGYGAAASHSMETILPQLAQTIQHLQTQQAALRRQIQVLEPPLQHAPIGYLQIDAENRLIFINREACKLLDIAAPIQREATDSTTRLLLEMVRSYELDNLVEATRATQAARQTDWLFHRISTDPSRIQRYPPVPLRAYSVPLVDNEVGIFVEDRQEPLRLTQQRDRWASDVAHELKTPLTSIRLVAETLHSRVDVPLQAWVDRLINETIRLSTLVQDLLDLSRLDRDASEALDIVPLNMADLIQRAWGSLEPLASKKHLCFNYDGPSNFLVRLDEARMFRVLLNLLDNAIKHSPERSVIQVQLSHHQGTAAPPEPSHSQAADPEPPDQPPPHPAAMPPDYDAALASTGSTVPPSSESAEADRAAPPLPPPCWWVDVIDMGEGFRSSDLPYVFDRFYQVDPSRARLPSQPASPTTVSSNSGLGLAIVRQIVEAHQGKVVAANHPETGGGWLRVWLPLTEGTPPAQSSSQS